MNARNVLFFLLSCALLAQGCAVYNSRYYYQDPPRPHYIAGLSIAPRVFAYQNQHGDSAEWKEVDSFQVSFRITDTTFRPVDVDLHKTDGERRVDADAFRKRVFSLFRIDSVVFQDRDREMGYLETGLPDTTRYVPQAVNYLTVHFGYINLPDSVGNLRAVVHLMRLDPKLSSLQDSAVFDLVREEYHKKGVQLFRDNVRGYEE